MIRRMHWVLLVAVLPLLLSGCSEGSGPSRGPAVAAPQPPATAPAGRPQTPRESADQAKRAKKDTWMSCSIQGSKIGYMHLREVPFEQEGRRWLRLEYEDRLVIARFQDQTVVETRSSSVESLDGRLKSFEFALKTGPSPLEARGRVEDGQLVIEETSQGRTRQRTIEFPPGCGGLFADQLSLARKPMQPGEIRRLEALVPVVFQIGEITLEAGQIEAVPLPSGSQQLLKIGVTTDLGSQELESYVWADREGTVWKTRDRQLGLEAVVTTREQALATGAPARFDLGVDTVVRVATPLQRPHETRRVRYRATLADGDLASLFTAGLSQQVRVLDERSAEVTVRAIRPEDPRVVPAGLEAQPTRAELQGSPLLQTDDQRVRQLASQVPGDAEDPWGLACKLEKHIRERVTEKNYGTAMATAAEVAQTLEGDCTEHAMLLAAVCRVRGIPSRVAIGLVYYPAAQAFAYHMWTEVWIRDRWIPLDATIGRGGIGAAHLKLAHSSMDGMQAFAELLPVIQAIGRLQLEIISVE